MSRKFYLKDLEPELRLSLLKLELLRREGSKFMWTTRDDKDIELDKMEITHLKNSINLLKESIKINREFESLRELLPADTTELY